MFTPLLTSTAIITPFIEVEHTIQSLALSLLRYIVIFHPSFTSVHISVMVGPIDKN